MENKLLLHLGFRGFQVIDGLDIGGRWGWVKARGRISSCTKGESQIDDLGSASCLRGLTCGAKQDADSWGDVSARIVHIGGISILEPNS